VREKWKCEEKKREQKIVDFIATGHVAFECHASEWSVVKLSAIHGLIIHGVHHSRSIQGEESACYSAYVRHYASIVQQYIILSASSSHATHDAKNTESTSTKKKRRSAKANQEGRTRRETQIAAPQGPRPHPQSNSLINHSLG
jgi:hypothetical protein